MTRKQTSAHIRRLRRKRWNRYAQGMWQYSVGLRDGEGWVAMTPITVTAPWTGSR